MIKIQRIKILLYLILSISITSGCQDNESDVNASMTTFNGYNLNHSYWMEDGSLEYSTNIYYFHDLQVTKYSFNKKEPSNRTYTCTTKGPYKIHLNYDKIEIESYKISEENEDKVESYFILKKKQDKFQLSYFEIRHVTSFGDHNGLIYMRNYHPITSIPTILTEK